jgi:hypothetical protein
MYRNSILAAAVCGIGAFMAADTGAPMGGHVVFHRHNQQG